MLQESEIRLAYQQTTVRESQYMLLYEFVIDNKSLFELDDKSLLNAIINTRILDKDLNHPELKHQWVEVCVEGIWRPFNFEKLTIDHFRFSANGDSFNEDIEALKRSETGSHFEDITFEQVTKEQAIVKNRTTFKNGIWMLDRDWFEKDNEVLDGLHWIFIYYKTYVEILRDNNTIRTIDFGWD